MLLSFAIELENLDQEEGSQKAMSLVLGDFSYSGID